MYMGVWNPRKDPTKFDTSKLKSNKKKHVNPYVEGARQMKIRNWGDALSSYKTALSEKPNDSLVPLAMYNIGVCYQELGEKDNAIDAYKGFLKKYPKHPKSKLAHNRLSK